MAKLTDNDLPEPSTLACDTEALNCRPSPWAKPTPAWMEPVGRSFTVTFISTWSGVSTTGGVSILTLSK
ncbi:hypothetical protein D3C85_1372440 [compost metagenome]